VIAILRTMTVGRAASTFRLDDEGRALAARLIQTFAREAAENGAAFLVVELPRKEDLAARNAGRDPWYAPLVREDLAGLDVADPTAGVVPEDALFAPRGHYAAPLNARIGEALAEPVLRAARARRDDL
jgi:hypothetical protein